MACSLPISSVHGILQARILKWVAVPSSRGSSQPGDPAHISYVSALAGGFFTSSTTCCCSVPQSCTTICDPMDCSTLCFLVLPISWSLLKLMSIESVMPSNHLILCLPLFLPSIFPSIRAFSNESALHIRWPKYWSFSFSISPSNGYSGLISLRIDWFDPFAVQGTLRSLLHSSKASIIWHSTFFMVQLSHPYMTTGKTKALTRQTFAGKVMFLLFNTLSRFVIAFVPWSKSLLISWLQSPSAVILGPKKIKSDTVSTVSPSIYHEMMGPDAMIFVF